MEDLKRQIRRLTGPQLIELRKYINNWRPTGEPSESLSWIEITFEFECKRLMLGFIQPAVKQIVRSYVPDLESFFKQACPVESKPVTKRVILSTGIDLLYKDLSGLGVVVSPKVLANSLCNVPAVLDRAFPGYARNGMLNIIVKRG